jgi:hypothetical protein
LLILKINHLDADAGTNLWYKGRVTVGIVVQNLYRVGNRWKFRKVVPQKLRPFVAGQLTEFVRWLGQGEQQTAEIIKNHASALSECEALLDVARKRAEGRYDDLTAEVIAHLITIARTDILLEDEDERFDEEADHLFAGVRHQLGSVPGSSSNRDTDRRWNKRQETLEGLLMDFRHDYARGNIGPAVTSEAEDLCLSQGLHPDLNGLSFRRLCKAYLMMSIEIIEAQLERQAGKIVATPAPPKAQSVQLVAAEGNTLRQMAEKKLGAVKRSGATSEATETALKLFEGVYGDRVMSSITRREVAEWIFLLQQKPAKPEKKHAKLGLKELVDVYKDRNDVARLSGKSINGHVGHLNAIWNFARKHGFVDRSLDNPFSEQRVEEVIPEAKEGFTPTQLQAIFNTPVFTAGERPAQGRGEAAFWIPLLLLTYGTRPEEMCQLLVSDIYQDEESGLWCLKITDEGDHPVKGSRQIKSNRNKVVRRSLPITEALEKLGFIDYVTGLKAAGQTALFPLLTLKGGYLYENFGRWWGEYLREHKAIPEAGNKPLRGFRDAWTTAASKSGLSEEEREWIQGHYMSKGRTSNRRYGIRNFGYRLNEITYKGLDLSRVTNIGK